MPRPACALLAVVMFSASCALSAAEPAFTPCTLLAPAEIQAALGKPVKPGTLKARSNPAAGSDCTWVVGDFGSLNLLIKPLARTETAATIKAAFVKQKMPPTDLPGVGDSSFYTSPGYGMVQLHTLKGARYLLITLLVPGAGEAAVRPAAASLMKTVLGRIK